MRSLLSALIRLDSVYYHMVEFYIIMAGIVGTVHPRGNIKYR